MKIVLLAFALLFLESNKTIGYRQLTYDDFTGTPSGDCAALSTTGIETGVYYGIGVNDSKKGTKGRMWFKSASYFVPGQSFLKVKSQKILKHEQGHFDITELYARKINQLLENPYTNDNSGKAYRLHDSLFAEMNTMQQLYDKESDYSRNDSMQKVWENKISLLVSRYR